MLDWPWPGGYLRRCHSCAFVFRDPVAAAETYEALYAEAPSTVWSTSRLRGDRAYVAEMIAMHSTGPVDVLDVGCYTGQLLGTLDVRCRKFGVEASRAAAAVAECDGVEIIARTTSELGQINQRFDVVVAIDVIEHLLDPSVFLRQMLDLTRPGGLVMVSTGDADAWPWRLAGAAYWYSEMAEHVSFISSSWAKRFAEQHCVPIEGMQRFRYYDEIDPGRWRSQLRFWVAAAKIALRHRLARLRGGADSQPRWILGGAGLFADHFVFALRKR
ncbi:class I SAM-dependent methyltransferase [Rhodoferax sp.]|uniref:class I SAM-dependent methyltransferase n=1 Tax=Rhodoferax sp. TaxID=50421 RepID=UPI002843012F|nr:class I SAM-dependent methyltransferase [Rhodoferax sp.]MDR3368498.1 class I SAM-dependent methyltransferase [Rhodoferax sp.]